ncbi:hypothetical protein OAL03_05020 [Akkermansiaceae bacterium]|nr:hypothetical protein [Akkermansiaceae bacterium]
MKPRTLFKIFYAKLIEYVNMIKGLFLALFFSSFKASRKMSKMHAQKKGCMVLANGPSLKGNLVHIQNERASCELFVMNYFCLSEYFFRLKPEYYSVADPLVFNSAEGVLKYKSKVNSFIRALNQVDWPCKLFYPSHFDADIVIDKINNAFIEKIKYNFTPLSSESRFIFRLYSKNLLMPIPESVIIASIFIAINMSFKNIHLFGVDHSWLTDFRVYENNTSSFTLDHFQEAVNGGNRKDSKQENDRSVSDFMLSQHRLFRSHEILQRYSEFKKVKITNKTLNSFIDCYEK